MAIPSVSGTPVTNGNASSATLDLTITPPVGTNAIIVAWGGFLNSPLTLTSVQGDPTGTPYNLVDLTLHHIQPTNQRIAGMYAIYDNDANWPGTGSPVTVRITYSGSPFNLEGVIFCLTDFDTTAGTNGTNTGDGGSGNPLLPVTSTTNALDIGCAGTYSADTGSTAGDDTVIGDTQNDAAAGSLYCWSENGAAGSNTVETHGASTSWAMVVASFEGTSGGAVDVTPDVDTITLSDPAPIVDTGVDITPTVDLIALSDPSPTVTAGNGLAVPDDFSGTGALGDPWETFNGSVLTCVRDSGYARLDVDDIDTLWFDGSRGRMDYQRVRFPTGGTPNEYHFYDIGVGPTSSSFTDNLTHPGSARYQFCGAIAHNANTSIQDWMFAVMGHRENTAATIEIKSTNGGSSTQTDEGANVVGTGVTRCDLAIELHNDGDVLFKYRAVGGGAWTYINSGSGLTPGTPPNLGSAGDEVIIGFVSYAFLAPDVPFTGSVGGFAVEYEEGAPVEVEPSVDSITLVDPAPTVVTGVNQNPTVDVITLSDPVPEIGIGVNVTPTVDSITLSDPTPIIASGVNVSPTLDSIALSDPSPTVSIGAQVTPTTDFVSISDPSPSVATGSNVVPITDAITLSDPNPTVGTVTEVTPSADVISITDAAPSVSTGAAIQPLADVIQLSDPAPTAGTVTEVTPDTDQITLSDPSPIVSSGASATPTAELIQLSDYQPQVSTSVNETPETDLITLSDPVPIVEAGEIQFISTITINGALYTTARIAGAGDMSVVPTPQNIQMVRGQDVNIVIPVTDAAGANVDLTTATVSFGIAYSKRRAYLHEPTVNKSGNEITVSLTGEISEQLTRSKYFYSCWVAIAGVDTPVAIGNILITDDSRNY